MVQCSAVFGDWEWETHLEDAPPDLEEPSTFQLGIG